MYNKKARIEYSFSTTKLPFLAQTYSSSNHDGRTPLVPLQYTTGCGPMQWATSSKSNSSELGGCVPSIASPVIMNKSIGGTLISRTRRWNVRVMGDYLSARAISKAFSADTIGRVRKWPNPMALTLSYTSDHIQAHNLKTSDHEPWDCMLPLAYERNKVKMC